MVVYAYLQTMVQMQANIITWLYNHGILNVYKQKLWHEFLTVLVEPRGAPWPGCWKYCTCCFNFGTNRCNLFCWPWLFEISIFSFMTLSTQNLLSTYLETSKRIPIGQFSVRAPRMQTVINGAMVFLCPVPIPLLWFFFIFQMQTQAFDKLPGSVGL